MKKVLFIGVTKYNLEKDVHLGKKFEGLSKEIEPYVLAKGRLLHPVRNFRQIFNYLKCPISAISNGVHKKNWGAEFYLLQPVFFWPLAFCLAPYLCLAKKIDVIICQSPLLEGFLGTILKRIFGKELIVEIHGDWKEGPFLSKRRKFEFLQRKFIPFLAKFSLKNADKIRGVAGYLVDEAKKIAPQKPYFIFPTFTDLDNFLQEKDVRFENFVLFVGHAHKVKGVEYLIKAFSMIEKDFPDFKLVLVGEGLPLGKLSLEEVRRKMRDCYCLVVPSLSEGLPRVIMEAQALAKPVIASHVGGIPELIKDGETGFLFEAGNVNDLAEKLRILLQKKQLAVEMGRRAREVVKEKFSNQRYIENYLKMINT